MKEKNDIYGIVGTIIVHVILIIVLIVMAFPPPTVEFPEPDGIVITFGEEVIGDGDNIPTQESVRPTPPPAPQQNIANEEENDVQTQDFVEAAAVNTTPKTTPKPKTKPVEKPRELTEAEKLEIERLKAEEEMKKKLDKLSGSNFSQNPGNSQQGAEQGNPGSKDGSPISTNTKGTPGNPFGNKDASYLPKPTNTVNCNNPIELTVKINSEGRVIEITNQETSLSEPACIEAARKSAMQARFSADASKTIRYAKITYDYTISKY